jgi:hypothetical protein
MVFHQRRPVPWAIARSAGGRDPVRREVLDRRLGAGIRAQNEPLPRVGQQMAVVDTEDRRVAVIELTEVRVVRLVHAVEDA